MAQTIFSKISDEIQQLVKNSTNIPLELRFLDPKAVLDNLNLGEEYLPLVLETLKYKIKREDKNIHFHNHYTDLSCWDGDKSYDENFVWKYLKHHKSATCRRVILSWYNDYLPENDADFEVGDSYIAYDGSFSLWLDAPTIKESKYFSEADEVNATFKVISKPYWCMIEDKLWSEPKHMINMVDVVSMKTGRAYRFLNANYNKSRFDKLEHDKMYNPKHYDDDYCDWDEYYDYND